MLILFIKNEYHAKKSRPVVVEPTLFDDRPRFFSLSLDVFYVKIF
ncbi:hypothetical protein HMPREF7215_1716 [Pyramidobacter piscolens W5455]|uniref:Uncharacterized protein n=1 Tax=Pyramidobacter piscolens W5455 TaxID=352165 RepID=A0ABP2HWQ5_9BACT|nr:hypothetical protein HMPREF7215_1716 [Pyramidobacter piscolens W5455]